MNKDLTLTANELLISEITAYISELVPINVNQIKSRLSKIMLKYHVQRVENDEVHPDLTENIDLFLAAKKLEGASKHTLYGYWLELNIFAKKVKKHTKDITASDIRVFLAQFSHLKMSSVGRKLSVLKSFFSWLAGEEIILKDPTTKLKQPKEEEVLPKALSVEELEMLREACVTLRQRALVEVLYSTGCRLSEIHDMNRDDIDFQSMSALVIGKGTKQREVYFTFKAMYHLKRYLESRSDDCEALFVTERRPYRRLSHRGIQRDVKKIAERVGLDHKVHPHVLRHTFATMMLNNGADLVAIQELLGHSEADTTLRYARISEERKKEQHKKYLIQ